MTSMRIRLTTGLPLVTCDDHQLGTVKEIQGDCFKVDAPMARDYWLAAGVVREVGVECAVVDFTKAQLDDYRLAGPDDGVLSPSPILDESTDVMSEGPARAVTRAEMREGYPSEITEMPDEDHDGHVEEPESAGMAEEPEGSILGAEEERMEARLHMEEDLEAARRDREAAQR